MYSRFGLLGLVLYSWGLDLGYRDGFGYGYGMDMVTAPALEWRLSSFFFLLFCVFWMFYRIYMGLEGFFIIICLV